MKRSFLLIVILSFVALFGCQPSLSTDYHKLGLVDVSGQIKYDGSPLANAYVKFEGDDGTYSFGKTNNRGYYKLMFNTEKSGIIPGEKTVRIRLSGAFGAEGGMLDGKGVGAMEGDMEGIETENGEPAPKSADIDEVPDAYHKQSKLKATVSKDSSSINFDLSPEGTTTGPDA